MEAGPRTQVHQEGDIVLDSSMEVVRRMEKIEIEKPLEILRIAVEENLTYYDASYLQAAIEKDLTLITDDKKLYVAGKKYIETLKSDEI